MLFRSASQALAFIAHESTAAANKMAAANPADFLALTAKWTDWPMLLSRRQREPLRAKHLEDFLAKIQLSEKHPLPYFIESAWDKNDDVGRVAWALWEHTYAMGKRVRQMHQNANETDWFSPTELEIKAAKLPAFNSSSEAYKLWWEVAQGFLLESYPKPLAVPLLKKINNGKKSSRSGSTGIRRALKETPQIKFLFGRLQDKFKSFAGENKYRLNRHMRRR